MKDIRDMEGKIIDTRMNDLRIYEGRCPTLRAQRDGVLYVKNHTMLWSSIFVTLMANKIGGLQFGIYRNCQISSRVFHTAVAALPLTKANRSDFE